jgi:hypothetical protein
MSRRCRLCDRTRDSYDAGTRKCRVCGAHVCPECAKRRYQAQPDEISERAKGDKDPGNDDLPVLPWRCEDCFLRSPTAFIHPKVPPAERVIRAAIDLVNEHSPTMETARKLALLVAVRMYQQWSREQVKTSKVRSRHA